MTSGGLADRECVPCTGEEEPLQGADLTALYTHLDTDIWQAIDGHHLEGTYEFEEFRDAFEFTKEVGKLAEEEWHHPEIHLAWGKVVIKLWTYVIDGLFETDFIMAARIDRIYQKYSTERGQLEE